MIKRVRKYDGIEFDMISDSDSIVEGFTTSWEHELINSWTNAFSFYPILTKESIVLDVGAGSGMFSLFAAKCGINVQVHAFEPDASIFNRLVANIGLNEFASKVSPHNYSLADVNGDSIMRGLLIDRAVSAILIQCEDKVNTLKGLSKVLLRDRPVCFMRQLSEDRYREVSEVMKSFGYLKRFQINTNGTIMEPYYFEVGDDPDYKDNKFRDFLFRDNL